MFCVSKWLLETKHGRSFDVKKKHPTSQLTFAVLLDPEGPFGLVWGFFSKPLKVEPLASKKKKQHDTTFHLRPFAPFVFLGKGWHLDERVQGFRSEARAAAGAAHRFVWVAKVGFRVVFYGFLVGFMVFYRVLTGFEPFLVSWSFLGGKTKQKNSNNV